MSPQHSISAHSSRYKGVNITIPLDDLLYLTLGDFYGSMSGQPYCSVPEKTAVILGIVFKDSDAYKIVWHIDEVTGEKLPQLWHFNAYMADQERQRKLKEYSEKLRQEGWIREANRKLISKAIRRKCPALPEDNCNMMAAKMLYSIDKFMPVLNEFWGVKKLITTIEEIP